MPLKRKDAFKRRIRGRADQLVRGVSLEAHGRLIRRTPVDTGRARGNWNVGVNRIDRTVDEDRLDPSGRTAIQEGQGRILAEVRAGDRVFITNSLPYIGELEDGSSKQAPEGMVKLTAAEMKRFVARVLARLADA